MNNKFRKLADIRIILFDLEGVLLINNEKSHSDKLKKISESLKNFCLKISKFDLKGGIVTASEEEELIKEFKSIPCCEILTSTIDKVSLVDKLISKLNLNYKNVFYIGDGLLDIPLLQKVGFSAAPRNSRREVKRVVDYICPAQDGESLLEDIGNLFLKVYSE
ncbi:HAD hydrolase family protein [Bacteroidota bacterium]